SPRGRRRGRAPALRRSGRSASGHNHRCKLRSFGSENAAAHLIELNALEQRLEIAFAEALVALALDDLEKDRADHVLRENLQQQPLALGRGAVHQYAALLELGDVLLVP